MRKIFFLFLCLISSLLVGCQKFADHRDPHDLYVLLPAEPSTLNSLISTDAYCSSVNSLISETLLNLNKDTLELEGELAQSWRISSDHLRYTFYLKKNVYWSDGVEFTADDIIYSFQMIMHPRIASASLKVYYKDVIAVKKINKYTVEFVYRKPMRSALEVCGSMPIIAKHLFWQKENLQEKLHYLNNHPRNRQPLGTGAYKFERWDTGKKIVLVRNELYRGKKPEIKRIIFKFVSEQHVALQMLRKGEIDVMTITPIQWQRQTSSTKFNKKFYKLYYYKPNYSWIGWNQQNEFFADKRVRRALTQLLNRQKILEKIYYNLGTVVTGNFYFNSTSYDQKIKPYPYDPQQALKLLHEAGWFDTDNDGLLDKNGKPFVFSFTIASNSSTAETLATIFKEDLFKVGIEMNINRYEWAVFVQRLQQKKFDAVMLAWSMSYDSDPYQIWHSSQIKSGSNFIGFNNPEADLLIEQGREEFDRQKLIPLYHRFHQILHEEQPYTFMFSFPALVVVSKNFSNVIVHKTGVDYREWTVAK